MLAKAQGWMQAGVRDVGAGVLLCAHTSTTS